jgi:hypothetical protein
MLETTDTNLEAVNTILGAIGDAPVDTLEDTTNINVVNASNELERVSKQEQANSWTFNILETYKLNPDVNTGRISWGAKFLKIVDRTNSKVLTRRGNFVYNLTDQTYAFGTAISVEAVLEADLEELPEQMRAYIVAKASCTFQAKFLGDPDLSQSLELERRDAWVALMEYECDATKYNIFDDEGLQRIRRP